MKVRKLGRDGIRETVEAKRAHFLLRCLESLFPPSLSESLPAPVPSLQGVLRQRVPLQGAVPLPHAQGGASVAGYAAEALARRKAELPHLVEADFAPFAGKLGPPEDGPSCKTKRDV